MQYMKVEDQLDPTRIRLHSEKCRLQKLLGTWVNTNPATQGLTKVVITSRGAKLVVRAFGAGQPVPGNWGEMEAEQLYANNINSSEAAGFVAHYRFGFAEVGLEANWNQGLLVVGSFTSFTDGGQHANYFSREFFHR